MSKKPEIKEEFPIGTHYLGICETCEEEEEIFYAGKHEPKIICQKCGNKLKRIK